MTFSADRPTPSLGGGLSALATINEGEPSSIQLMLVGTPYHPAITEGPEPGFTLAVGLMKPTSRGSVRLSGPGVSSPPLTDPNLLGTRHDADLMADRIRAARELATARGAPDKLVDAEQVVRVGGGSRGACR